MTCLHFFHARKIADNDRISAIAPSFRDPHISAWYFANETKLKALTYADFWNAFKVRWFKKNWASEILTQIKLSAMPEDAEFDTWIEELQRKNTLLLGLPAHMSDDQLRDHLRTHTCRELREFAVSKEGLEP